MMHHPLDSCCQYDFKIQVCLSECGCRSGLHLMFIVFLFWFWPPFEQSKVFLQPLFWNLKIILIAEIKIEPVIFPQRPGYFLEPWPTYPHCDSTLKMDITHQLTLRRTVLQSDGHHFFLPMQLLWHTDARGKKKKKKRSCFKYFHQACIRKNG